MLNKMTFAAVALALMTSATAMAEDGAGGGKRDGKNFEQHKAKILERIDQRLAEGQKRRACVAAASDAAALKACMPERKEGGRGGKLRKRGGDDGDAQ